MAQTHTHTDRKQTDIGDSKLDQPKGQFSENMPQLLNICEWASKLPKNSIFLECPLPGMILPGHSDRVHWYELQFWTAWDFSDLVQQADLYKTILVTELPKKLHWFKISPILADFATDRRTLWVIDWIGLGANSVKIYWMQVFLLG